MAEQATLNMVFAKLTRKIFPVMVPKRVIHGHQVHPKPRLLTPGPFSACPAPHGDRPKQQRKSLSVRCVHGSAPLHGVASLPKIEKGLKPFDIDLVS